MAGLGEIGQMQQPGPQGSGGLMSAPPVDRNPPIGPLKGALHLNPAIAPKTAGNARPFAPGEWVDNPNGSWSSEISTTVSNPTLNGGAPTNVPSLWLVGGKPVRVTEDQAAQLAAESGLKWPAFQTEDEAIKASDQRELNWQGIEPKDAGKIAPLWATQ